MNGQHAIDELVLDLSFSSNRLTRHENAELADWVSHEFLPQLDKLFSIYSAGTQVLYFENIKLDLGWLPARYYRQEIVRQTCAQLEFLIAQASLQISSSSSTASINQLPGINLHQQQLEQLLVFLRTGQLPFHRDNERQQAAHGQSPSAHEFSPGAHDFSPRAHEKLLEQVLDKHNILAALRALPQRQELLKRFTTQFSSRHLAELIRQLAPEQFNNIQVLVDLWEIAQTTRVTTASDKKPIPELPGLQSLWFELLDTFLSHDYLNQPANNWLEQVFAQLHKKHGVTLEAITERLLVPAHRLQSQPHQLLIKELAYLLEKNASPLEERIPTKEKVIANKETARFPSPNSKQKEQLQLFTEQPTAYSEPVENNPQPTLVNNTLPERQEIDSLASWLIKLQQELSYALDSNIALFAKTYLIQQARQVLSVQYVELLVAFVEKHIRTYRQMIEFFRFMESLADVYRINETETVFDVLLQAARDYQPTTAQIISKSADGAIQLTSYINSPLKTPQEELAQKELPNHDPVITNTLLVSAAEITDSEVQRNQLAEIFSTNEFSEVIQHGNYLPTEKSKTLANITINNNIAIYFNDLLKTLSDREPGIAAITNNYQVKLGKELSTQDSATTNTTLAETTSAKDRAIWQEPQLTNSSVEKISIETATYTNDKTIPLSVITTNTQSTTASNSHPTSSSYETASTFNNTIDNIEFPTAKQPGFTPAQAKNFLATLLIKGDPSGLNIYWPALLREHPGLVAASLKHFLVQPEIRQQLMVNFPLHVLIDMLELYEPATQPGFNRLLENASLLNSIDVSNPTSATASIEWWQRQLWEIVLSSVINERPASAEKLFQAIIRTYAALNNLDEKSIAQTWNNIVTGVSVRHSENEKSGKSQLLEELPEELTDSDQFSTQPLTARSTQEQGNSNISPSLLSHINSLRALLSGISPSLSLENLLQQIGQLAPAEIVQIYQQLYVTPLQGETSIQNATSLPSFSTTPKPSALKPYEWRLLLTQLLDHYSDSNVARYKKMVIAAPIKANLSEADTNLFYSRLFIAALQQNIETVQKLLQSVGVISGKQAPDAEIETEKSVAALEPVSDSNQKGLIGSNQNVEQVEAQYLNQLLGAIANTWSTTALAQTIPQIKALPSAQQKIVQNGLARFIADAEPGDITDSHWKLISEYLLEDKEKYYLDTGIRQLLEKSLLTETKASERMVAATTSLSLLISILAEEATDKQTFYKALVQILLTESGTIEKRLIELVNNVLSRSGLLDSPSLQRSVTTDQRIGIHSDDSSDKLSESNNSSKLDKANISSEDLSKTEGQGIEGTRQDQTGNFWSKQNLTTSGLQRIIPRLQELSAVKLRLAHHHLKLAITNITDHANTNWRLLLAHLLDTNHKHGWLQFASASIELPKPQDWLSVLDEAATEVADAKLFYKSLVNDLLSDNGQRLYNMITQYARSHIDTHKISPPPQPITTAPNTITLHEASNQTLLDTCTQLKSGALAWSALPKDLPILQRLLTTYILQSGAIANSLQQDLLSAINQHLGSTPYKENYYLVVLGHLLADKPLDLEDIIAKLQIQPASTSEQAYSFTPDDSDTHKKPKQNHTYSAADNNNITITDQERIQKKSNLHKNSLDKPHLTDTPTDTPQVPVMIENSSLVKNQTGLARLAQELINNSVSVHNITLNDQEWFALVEQVIRDNDIVAKDFQQDLLRAIRHHLPITQKRHAYYRHVLQQLITGEALDVEEIATQLEKKITPLIQNEISTISDQSSPATPAEEKETDCAVIYQQIRTGNYQLLDSGLGTTQWRDLITYLLNRNKQFSTEFHTELLAAIDIQATKAIYPANFYRHLAIALADEKPLDLEAMAIAPVIEHKSVQQRVEARQPLNQKETNLPMDSSNVYTQEYAHPNQEISREIYEGKNDETLARFDALKELLTQTSVLSGTQMISLQKIVQQILAGGSDNERNYWLPLLKQKTLTDRLVDLLPAHILHSLFKHLFSREYPTLDSMIKLLGEVLVLLIQDYNSPALKKAKWQFIIEQLVAPIAGLSQEDLFKELGERAAMAANLGESQRLMNLLHRRIGLLKKPVPQTESSFQLVDIAKNNVHDQAALETGIHINNAGMVLMAPFMPRLFSMLKLTDQGRFIHMGAAERGAHLLQYAVTGSTESPEYEMLLNKVLCGMNTSIPIADRFEISEEEKTIIEQLLQSMIQHWKVLGSTSITGLRQTFMQRQAHLSLEDDYWQLKVQQGTFDMLLDQLPWNISLVKHAWMDKPLHINWR